ncbi:alpha/beta hydrolase [Solibacillus sp. MA9]|uniref:Alpha/beta hydrolase n=1 Tax=Solibacillus palustris TaxID=2908203 RepID=A0ABS9UC97_9BACL|nr:alpha/beta hydrolase [Solibacillus sp. MA9]MCH7321967.1 alpha/beta hydrolase [Solibacillus sp. MA9]
MRSWQSVAFKWYLIMRGSKKKFQNPKLLDDFIASKYNELPYQLDESFRVKKDILKNEISGMRYYTINEQRKPKKVIYYFHGGAYINDPLSFHWRYLIKLAKATDYTIVVPIYPKLPRHTVLECYEAIYALYERLLEHYDAPFIFMGDSAGGGLALGFAQDVKLLNKRQPEHIILNSPWLDVTGVDPRYKQLEKIDPMLGIQGAQELGRLWAKDVGIKNYKVSPLNGDIQDIGKLTLFVGTGELLLVDAHMLREKAQQEHVPLQYFEYSKMNHVFPVFPVPEAKKAFKELLKIIQT